jgi:hypothetical protein
MDRTLETHVPSVTYTAAPKALAARPITASGEAKEITLSTAAVVILVGVLALLLSLPFVTQLQADSYKALYDGRWIVHHGLPHVEALTVMAHGRTWIDEQWLAEVFFFEAWRFGGYGLVAVVALGAVSLAYMILAALMSRRGASAGVVIFCAALAILSLTGWQFIRSQDLALPLFAGMLAVCVIDCGRKRPTALLFLLLPLLILWANLHGSVLLGALLAAAYVLFRAISAARGGQLAVAAVLGGLAAATAMTPLATPYGAQIIHYYLEFLGNSPMARLAIEWAPPRYPSFLFFELCVPAVLTAVVVGFASIKRRRPHAVLVAAAVLTAVAAALESGSIVWFGMAAAVLLADALKAWFPRRPHAPFALFVVTAVAAVLGGFALTQLVGRSDGSYEALVPHRVISAATAYAASHPCALILADNLSSSALLWREPWLDGRMGFDARLEQYSQPALRRWLAFMEGGAGWTATHNGYELLLGNSVYAAALVRRLDQFPASALLARQGYELAVVSRAPPPSRTDCEGTATKGRA